VSKKPPCDDALCAEFGHAPCTESAFWKQVREAAKEVATWPQWKKAGVVTKPAEDKRENIE